MGYEQAIARRQELRGITVDSLSGAAASRTGAATPADAALFQQQLASMAMVDDESSASGNASSGDAPDMSALVPGAGGSDPYAALQSGGLSTQAQLLAQVSSSSGAAASTQQIQQLLAQMQSQQLGLASPVAGTGSVTATRVSGKVDGLDPELLRRLDAVGAELGKTIDVISGNRTRAEQAELYRRYLDGTGNLAAPPGQSNHEHGDAADVYVDGVALANVPGARDAAARLGLHFPVGGEAWHVERSDR